VRYIYVSLPTGCKPCSEAGGGFGSQRSSWGSTCEENEISEIFSHIGDQKYDEQLKKHFEEIEEKKIIVKNHES
jgi:hypothetical protein